MDELVNLVTSEMLERSSNEHQLPQHNLKH